MKKNKNSIVHLETPFEAEMGDVPHNYYPRPQLRRESYICLNGKWQLSAKNGEKINELGEILVPFPPESRLSGICREISLNETLVYTRTFTLPEGFMRDKVILHFGAVDQYATVFVNGINVGFNIGGYLPFSFDITEFLVSGENTLTVEAFDPLDRDLGYGKQSKKRGGMWYTKTSGIWQTVWLESVPENHIEALEILSDTYSVTVKVLGGEDRKNIKINLPEGELSLDFAGESIKIDIDTPQLWTPETPYLYDFSVTSGDDTVHSYFALRTVFAEGRKILLNGSPYFFHGLLDQGYYSDGIFLPATARGFENDILQMKACGFNMLRKHIKLEPDIFYYLCDKLGMAVFQDFINSGSYSFLIDTALPTIGLRRGITHRAYESRKTHFMRESEGIMKQLASHPSVVYYTIFNEGWGQFESDKCYEHFKALDPSRVFDTTSGWFKETKTDVESDHVYFKPVDLKTTDKPMVLSEFGGYVCKIEGHSANPAKTYGYKFFNSTAELEAALIAMYEKEIIPMIGRGLCAAVLTQISDVEDETNGLLTYDRKILKVEPENMKKLADKLFAEFEATNSANG